MAHPYTRVLACAALLGAAGCRSAFAPEPVLQLSAPPVTDAPATVSRQAPLRSGPDRGARVLAQLEAGTAVTASTSPMRGFLRVRTADGKSGYVEQEAVSQSAAAPTSAPAP